MSIYTHYIFFDKFTGDDEDNFVILGDKCYLNEHTNQIYKTFIVELSISSYNTLCCILDRRRPWKKPGLYSFKLKMDYLTIKTL